MQLRLCYPFPLWPIVFFAFFYFLCEPLFFLMFFTWREFSGSPIQETIPEQLRAQFFAILGDYESIYREHANMHLLLLSSTAALYGGFRAYNFHPLFFEDYHAALSVLPWRSGKPLPKGELRYGLIDLVVMAALAALALRAGLSEALMVLAFAIGGYTLMAASAAYATGETAWGRLSALSLAALVWSLWHHPWPLLMLPISAAIGDRAALASLQQFPWKSTGLSDGPQHDAHQVNVMGWPLAHLLPRRQPAMSAEGKLLVTLLAALAYWFGIEYVGFLQMNILVLPGWIFIVGFYMSAWFLNYLPPMSLLARLQTGRLVIYRYDSLFIAPVLSCLVLVGGCFMSTRFNSAGTAVAVTSLAASFLIMLFPVPSRQRWLATGAFRIAKPSAGDEVTGDVARV